MGFEESDSLEAGSIYVPIPKVFHSVYEEGPFSRCIICSTNLLEPACEYMIEKVFRGTEVIVEYAMCQRCAEQLGSELSRESTERIERYLAERVDWAGRVRRLAEHLAESGDTGDDIEPWIERCLITGLPRRELEAYQICAKCRGSRVERTLLPFVVADQAIREVGKLLSRKTRDRLDDFVGDYLGMDPELVNAPVDPAVMLF